MKICSRNIPNYVDTLTFPVDLLASGADLSSIENAVVRQASKAELLLLASMNLVIGIGSRTKIRHLILTGPIERAYENAAREAKLTRLSRGRPPLEFLHRMMAARQNVQKVHIGQMDPESGIFIRSGLWYRKHKTPNKF